MNVLLFIVLFGIFVVNECLCVLVVNIVNLVVSN